MDFGTNSEPSLPLHLYNNIGDILLLVIISEIRDHNGRSEQGGRGEGKGAICNRIVSATGGGGGAALLLFQSVW